MHKIKITVLKTIFDRELKRWCPGLNSLSDTVGWSVFDEAYSKFDRFSNEVRKVICQ